MIDDPIDFEYEEEEEDDCNTYPVLRTPGPDEATTTPPSSGKSKSKLARKEKGIESVLEKMSQGQVEMNKLVTEIAGMMRSAGDIRSTSRLFGGEPHEIMDQINKSMTLIGTRQKELKDLCRQKVDNHERRNQCRVDSNTVEENEDYFKVYQRSEDHDRHIEECDGGPTQEVDVGD
jgi:hypothetical protein